jgi:uncharacterized Tic20 family protein
MDGKLQIVGTIWSVISILMMLVAFAMIAFVAFGLFIDYLHWSDLGVFMFVGTYCVVTALAIAAGGAIKQRRPWARTTIIVLSIIIMFGFPIGTVIGGYSLWILLSDDARAAFAIE